MSHSHDNANHLKQVTQGTASVAFNYDGDGRRTSTTLPNGVAMNYSYDAASQLSGITYMQGATQLGSLTYAYDLAGRRTGVGGSYARTSVPLAASAATYNVNNQLTNWKGATLTYDANGNLTGDGSFSFWIFLLEGTDTWNARNQLVTISGGVSASFQYDAFGRRVNKTIGGTTQFLYDGVNPVQEISGTTASANLLTGGVDEYFQRTDSAGARSFLTDALGSTLALADSTGTIQTSYTFEPFGNTTVTGATTNSFAFTGRELDPTGLYFYRARYYSPSLQRFISEDPLAFRANSVNFYEYTYDNPQGYKDPSGEQEILLEGGPISVLEETTGRGLTNGDIFGRYVPYAPPNLDPLLDTNPLPQPKSPMAGRKGGGGGGGGGRGTNDPCHPSNFDAYAQSASEPFNLSGTISNAGRALQKHGGRQGFPVPTGSPADINALAQQIIEEILTNPGSSCSVDPKNRINIRLPNGQGARWDLNGGFIGLIGP